MTAHRPGLSPEALGASLSVWKNLLLDLFFPRRCIECGDEGAFLCGRCNAQLQRLEAPRCSQCGLPLPTEAVCRACQELPLCLDSIRSLYAYQGSLRELLIQFKYRGVRAIGAELAVALGDYLTANPLTVDVIVPVPLYPSRRRERGYNQAEVLAQKLGQQLRLPAVPDALARVRSTPPQARLGSRDERRQNVAGAFLAEPDAVSEKRVLLIDDVCTTGATLSACGEALRAAGATAVRGLTVAREL